MYCLDIYYPYEVVQMKNVLKFFKEKTLIGELLIDNYDVVIKYYSSKLSLSARIYFHRKIEKIPTVIPNGYSNPKLIEGYYRVKDTRTFQEEEAYKKLREIVFSDYIRELAYIDTSQIKEEEYFECWKQYGYTNLTIPKSFWVQPDWRNWCGGWTTLAQTLLLINNFDTENNSMCITKDEACYLAYIRRKGSSMFREIKEGIIEVFKDQPKEVYGSKVLYPYDVNFASISNDNWRVLAVDNKKNYSLIGMDDCIEAVRMRLIDEIPVDFNTKATGMWGIPVVHTTENLVRKLEMK